MLSAPPAGLTKTSLKHTDELMPGDRIYIEFPAFSGGSLLFGSSVTFKVSKAVPGQGVWFTDEKGKTPSQIPMPLYGTYDDLLSKLKEKTSVDKLEIYRPPGIAKAYGSDKLEDHIEVPWTSKITPGMIVSRKLDDGWWLVKVDSVSPESGKPGSYEVKGTVISVPPSAGAGGKRNVGETYSYSTADIAKPGTGWSLWMPSSIAVASEEGGGFPWKIVLAVVGIAVVVGGIYYFVKARKSE